MKGWLVRLFRRENPVVWTGLPRFVCYKDAESLIADGWKIYTPNEDRNIVVGYVWLCKVQP